jgi:hypothetical protein
MNSLFKDLVIPIPIPNKYSLGIILGAATLDGYRRQLINDRKNNILEEIQKQRDALLLPLPVAFAKAKEEQRSEDRKVAYDKAIEEMYNNTKNKAAILRYNEAADET